MNKATCPCCGRPDVALVRADRVLEAHLRPDGVQQNPRSGRYCAGSGYTVEQAKRWSMLPEFEQRALVAARTWPVQP